MKLNQPIEILKCGDSLSNIYLKIFPFFHWYAKWWNKSLQHKRFLKKASIQQNQEKYCLNSCLHRTLQSMFWLLSTVKKKFQANKPMKYCVIELFWHVFKVKCWEEFHLDCNLVLLFSRFNLVCYWGDCFGTLLLYPSKRQVGSQKGFVVRLQEFSFRGYRISWVLLPKSCPNVC